MVIKILRLDKLIEKFGDISKIDLTPELREATIKVQRTAKDLAPNNTGFTPSEAKSRSTGQLKRSIKRRVNKRGQFGMVYSDVEHAVYNEYGTKKMVAQPFLRPAMNTHRLGIHQSMKKFIKDELRRRAK